MIRLPFPLFPAVLATAACGVPAAAPPAAAGSAAVRDCPDWSRSSTEDFTNRDASNFGCTHARNFEAQLVDPTDARRGRSANAGDSHGAAAAIARLRSGRVQLPGNSTAPTPANVPGSDA